jgi:CxxC-x17-CxxC domain-containing protein
MEVSFSKVYTDRSLTCVDCGQEFSFTAGEQEFYAQRGFTESPKRCPSCRQIRKAQRNRGSGESYGAPSGGDSYGGSSSYGGGYESSGYGNGGSGGGYSGGYGGERRQREMFDAVCANCGKTASVPFRPSGNKPVYCSDCFESRR